jgi:hypothetical protein
VVASLNLFYCQTIDDLISKQNALLAQCREQSLNLETLNDDYFTNQLPAMIKTMKELDSDLSSGINQFLHLFLSTWHTIFLESSHKLKARDSASAFNFLSKIHDSHDVMAQYKDFYEAAQVESAAIEKGLDRRRRFSSK